MALTIPAPQAAPNDLVTLWEAWALLHDTPNPPSESTIRRWIQKYGIPVKRTHRAHRVSFTDLLEAQRDEAERVRPEP